MRNVILFKAGRSMSSSRPLFTLTQYPDYLDILTPGHFLIGTALSAILQDEITELKSRKIEDIRINSQI